MTTKKKQSCSKPATAMVKLGDSEWTPCCDAHVDAARAKSAKAGSKKVGSGKDAPTVDNLAVHVRPLSELEKENKPRCLISRLEA